MSRKLERLDLGYGTSTSVLVHRAGPGPVVVVAANVHGDEVTGLRAIHLLDGWLEEELQRGTVVLYPSLNPRGLSARAREVPGSDGDLNRAFPGDPRGTGAERVAAAAWRDLERRRPDVVVDLHADSSRAIPYAIVDRAITPLAVQREDLAQRLAAVAQATGLTVLWEYPDERYQRYRLDRSLAGAVVNALAAPAVTVESGPRRRIDPAAVEAAAMATRGVLAWAGCVAARPWTHPTRVEGTWERSSSLRARYAGLFVPELAAGREFHSGEVLGRIWSVDGRALEEVRAVARGVVISWVDGSWVEPGGIVGTLGVATA